MTREITFDILSLQNRKSGPDGSSRSIRRDPFRKNGLPGPPIEVLGLRALGFWGLVGVAETAAGSADPWTSS